MILFNSFIIELNNYTLSSAKCSNTAYGAKPSRTTNHLVDEVINILTIKLFVKWLKDMMKESAYVV